MEKRSLLTRLTLTVLALSVIAACTKKRDDSFVQGQGRDLYKISDYDNKEFSLQTTTKVGALSVTSAQSKTSTNNSFGRNFDLVNYTTDADLMTDVPFIGKENHTYKIVYKVSDNYLKVYKVAPEAELSLQEQTYATDFGGGQLGVPLVGYPLVGLYTVEHNKNDLNEDTSKLGEQSQSSLKNATHFRINRSSKEIFQAVEKVDLFPKKFLEGDWYFAQTVVGVNFRDKDSYLTDAQDSSDKFGVEAGKVRIRKDANALVFYNLNIDANLLGKIKSQQENQAEVISIPVDWKDFRLSPKGTDTAMTDQEDTTRRWEDRAYAKLDFAKTISPLTRDNTQSQLVDLQIDDNYLGFTLLNTATNTRVRYSFLRATERNYTPKVYFKDDQKKFGFFKTDKSVVQTSVNNRLEQIEQNFLLNRYNPNLDEIVFHLSDNSPDWTEEVAVKALAAWDRAFKAASVKTHIKFDKKRVQLGDIRYNVINMNDDIEGAGPWGGYGPRIGDGSTGETISSTANINVTDSTEAHLIFIRRLLKAEIGQLDKRYVLGDIMPSLQMVPDAANGAVKILDSNLTFLTGMSLPFFDKDAKTAVSFKKMTFAAGRSGFEKDLKVTLSDLRQKITKQCPVVESYFQARAQEAKAKQNVNRDYKNEDKIFADCSMILSKDEMLPVLLHELGHNFGLRHNFYGSVDAKNFYDSRAKGGALYRTSSVMEYTTFNEPRPSELAPYDIAAIRFGYSNALETADHQLMSIDPKFSIAQNVNAQRKTLRDFKYCTDEDVDVTPVDPLCARQDAGTTALEIVKNHILNYNSSYAIANFKDENYHATDDSYLAQSRMQTYFIPMRKIYTQWRMYVADFAGAGNEYLENMTAAQYQDLLSRMMADPKNGATYKDYKAAADEVFNFFKNLAFMPDRYCLINADGANSLISLSHLRQVVYSKTAVSINSCAEDAALKEIRVSFPNAQLKAQGGYNYEDTYYNMDINQATQYSPDIIGNKWDRLLATWMLAARDTLLSQNITRQFVPNFYDEPPYRAELMQKSVERMTNGVDMRSFDATLQTNVFSSNFVNERDLLRNYIYMMKTGLKIPDRTAVTSRRMEKFTIQEITTADQVESVKNGSANIVKIYGRIYIADRKANGVAAALADRLSQVQVAGSLVPVSMADYEAMLPFIDAFPSASQPNVPFTVQQFKDAFTRLAQNFTSVPTLGDSAKGVVFMSALAPEVHFYNGMTGQLDQLKTDPVHANQFLTVDLMVPIKPGTPYQSTREAIKARLQEAIRKNNTQVQDYQGHIEDYNTQQDVLMDALIY